MKDLWLRAGCEEENATSKLHLFSALRSIFQRWPAAPEIYFRVTLHTIGYNVKQNATERSCDRSSGNINTGCNFNEKGRDAPRKRAKGLLIYGGSFPPHLLDTRHRPEDDAMFQRENLLPVRRKLS